MIIYKFYDFGEEVHSSHNHEDFVIRREISSCDVCYIHWWDGTHGSKEKNYSVCLLTFFFGDVFQNDIASYIISMLESSQSQKEKYSRQDR